MLLGGKKIYTFVIFSVLQNFFFYQGKKRGIYTFAFKVSKDFSYVWRMTRTNPEGQKIKWKEGEIEQKQITYAEKMDADLHLNPFFVFQNHQWQKIKIRSRQNEWNHDLWKTYAIFVSCKFIPSAFSSSSLSLSLIWHNCWL